MKRILLFFSLIASCSASLFAQVNPTLPDAVEVFFPKVLQSLTVKESEIEKLLNDKDFGQRTQVSNKRHWIAFSDRTDNVLYQGPSAASQKCGVLDFNEEVRIARIERGYALVYVEDEPNTPYPKISARAKNSKKRGWVSIKNLLIWHTCPTNESGIYNKALLCVNLDQLRNENYDLGNLYLNPRNRTEYDKLQSEMDFYFIMKRDPETGMVLLSKSHSQVSGLSNEMLRGWVSEKSYVAWDQRTCIEPTWEKKDVVQLAAGGARFQVYGDEALTKKATHYAFKDEVMNRPPYEYRMAPHQYRFPILNTVKRKDRNGNEQVIYKFSTFATPGGGSEDIRELENLPDPGKVSQDILKTMTNIDIAFVIDGTKSMEKYFESVKLAIRDAEKFFDSDKFKIRVGLVIYRDYLDGDGKVEYMEFRNPRHPDLIKMLDEGGKYGIGSHKKDYSLEEALYLGVDTALDKLGFQKRRSNLLFVVGDCGNIVNDTQFSRDDIVAKLVEKDVNLMGFQVKNGMEEAYGDFNEQIKYLMRSSVEKKYRNLSESANIRVVWKNIGNGVKLENNLESWLYIGTHNNPAKGTAMSMEKLTEQIGDAVLYFRESVQSRMKIISNNGTPGFKSGGNIDALKLEEGFLKEMAGDDYEVLKKSQSFMSFNGYTPKTVKGIDVCKTIVFMSSDELQKLITDLNPVAVAAKSNDREAYQNAMISLVRTLTGHDDETIKNLDLKRVMEMIGGLNEATESLNNIPLRDITDVRKVSNADYQKYVSNFTRKYNRLFDVRNSPYPFTKTIDGMKYYWLPIEYLP